MAIQNERMRARVVADELISVTIDATDLGVSSTDALRSIISRYGRPISARAFADFQQPGISDLSVQLYQMGFTLVHCPTWPNGDGAPKPIVSDVMAQDLRDQLEELEEAETFLLVATSRDYIAVANAIRRHDRRVVVVAEEAKVCREFRMCADEFVALPPGRPERSQEPARPSRASESGRSGRSTSVPKIERTLEPVRMERPPEPARNERAPEPVRAEGQDQARLPSDGEVLAEVRKIIAAEGICTPRRLARALCPVDRTPTGELRSRIANRIQSLVDSGKLLRERLVVGGTSVETILTREDRNGRAGVGTPEGATPAATPLLPLAPAEEVGSADALEAAGIDGMIRGEPLEELAGDSRSAETERAEDAPGADLDAFVESVLRGAEPFSVKAVQEPAANQEMDQLAVADLAAASAEPTIPPAGTTIPAKRTRSRRKPSSKTTTVPESNGVE